MGRPNIVQSGDDTTQIPAEFAPTQLPEPSKTDGEQGLQPRSLTKTHPPVHPPTEQFHWGLIRWGSVAIAAAALAQTSTSLLTSLVVPTFAQHIEQAKTSGAWLKINAMNQAQQVHFLDHGEFSEALVTLDLGIVSHSQYYDYRIQQESQRSRRKRLAPADQQIVVSLALPHEPGLPVLWGAILAQGSDRLADSLICQKPAPPTSLAQKLRQQLKSSKLKHRTRTTPIPTVPPRLECPPGFTPRNLID